MRSIGNIERFLVIGIVVVIGAILAVAIRGADDLNSNYNDRVAKSKTADPKKGGAPPLRVEVPRGNPAAGHTEAHPADPKTTADAGGSRLPPDLKEALDKKLDSMKDPAGKSGTDAGNKADVAKPDPSKTPNGKDGGAVANGLEGTPANSGDDAPVVVDGETKSPVTKTPDNGGAKSEGAGEISKAGSKDVGGRTDPAPATLEWTYEVQSGDKLERIASALYGERSMWKEIANANPTITDVGRLKVGQKLALPKDPVNTAVVGLSHGSGTHQHVSVPDHLQPKDDAKGDSSKVASTATEKSKSSGFKRVTSSDQYQVQHGDTLMAIAATNYGTRSAWRMILDANSDVISDKDHIKPGTVIKLPAE
jgi:nucleoid-associated protein YgaU